MKSPREHALILTPYAVEARYDDTMTPTLADTRAALDIARNTRAFAANIIAP